MDKGILLLSVHTIRFLKFLMGSAMPHQSTYSHPQCLAAIAPAPWRTVPTLVLDPEQSSRHERRIFDGEPIQFSSVLIAVTQERPDFARRLYAVRC
jgi:hypothetical protein